jgi:hypothetical protein
MDKMREEFEKWLIWRTGSERFTDKHDDGTYCEGYSREHWESWQAACEYQRQSTIEECAKVCDDYEIYLSNSHTCDTPSEVIEGSEGIATDCAVRIRALSAKGKD